MDLFIDFGGQMRQTCIVNFERIWSVAGEVHPSYAQAFRGTQQRANIMATPQVMSDQNDLFHPAIIRNIATYIKI